MAENIPVTKSEKQTVVPEHVSSGPKFSARVDVIEKPHAALILVDMPGVPKNKVDVVLDKGVLTINGEAASAHEPGMRLEREEYEVGNFHRCFSVGEGLDASGVEATMKDGILRLLIPKSGQYAARRIEVKGQ